MRTAALLATLSLTAAALVGCGADDTIAGRPHEGTATATPGADGVQEVRVTSDETFRFHPSTIVASTGRLRIRLRNDGPTRHDLEVPALDASTGAVLGGSTGEVVLTLDKPGEYAFRCTYHERQDMTGTLVVR